MVENTENILIILGKDPEFVNVGLELFAETLEHQGATVSMVLWKPPPKTPPDILNILNQIS